MNKGVMVAVATAIVVAVGVGVLSAERAAPEVAPASFVDVTFDELSLEQPNVRLEGVGHYGSSFRQSIAATLFHERKEWSIIGFFPKDDLQRRAIPVLVRSERPLEGGVNYEYMTVEGVLKPMSPETVPAHMEGTLSSKTPYFFDEPIYVLEAWRIESGKDVWVRPTPSP